MSNAREILNNLLLGNIRTVEDALLALEVVGYRQIPELTVLSWEEIRMAFQENDKKGTTVNIFRLELIAQAQRDKDQREIDQALELLPQSIESEG